MWRKILSAMLVAMALAPLAQFTASALTVSPLTFEYDVQPGGTVVGNVKFYTETDADETYYPSVRDFKAGTDETGTPQFETVSEAGARSMASWVTFSMTKITVASHDFANVPFTITTPKNAAPGGYYAALLFGTSAPSTTTGVGVSGLTGPLVLVRVAGTVVEKGSITDFSVSPDSATSLPVNFGIRFQNSGTVHLKPTGVIKVTNMFGGTSAVIPVNAEGGNVLPDSARLFSAAWLKAQLPDNASELVKEWMNFGLGKYTATLMLNYGETNQVASATQTFWVMPWMLIILFMILVVILVLLVMQYNKWLIAKYAKRK